MDKIQFFNDMVLKKFFPKYGDYSDIFSGKFGAPSSFANLMEKYKAGRAGVGFW